MNNSDLFRVRIALVQTFLQDNEYDGVLLTRVDNFAMATGGKRNYVYVASDLGACSLFVTKDGGLFCREQYRRNAGHGGRTRRGGLWDSRVLMV